MANAEKILDSSFNNKLSGTDIITLKYYKTNLDTDYYQFESLWNSDTNTLTVALDLNRLKTEIDKVTSIYIYYGDKNWNNQNLGITINGLSNLPAEKNLPIRHDLVHFTIKIDGTVNAKIETYLVNKNVSFLESAGCIEGMNYNRASSSNLVDGKSYENYKSRIVVNRNTEPIFINADGEWISGYRLMKVYKSISLSAPDLISDSEGLYAQAGSKIAITGVCTFDLYRVYSDGYTEEVSTGQTETLGNNVILSAIYDKTYSLPIDQNIDIIDTSEITKKTTLSVTGTVKYTDASNNVVSVVGTLSIIVHTVWMSEYSSDLAYNSNQSDFTPVLLFDNIAGNSGWYPDTDNQGTIIIYTDSISSSVSITSTNSFSSYFSYTKTSELDEYINQYKHTISISTKYANLTSSPIILLCSLKIDGSDQESNFYCIQRPTLNPSVYINDSLYTDGSTFKVTGPGRFEYSVLVKDSNDVNYYIWEATKSNITNPIHLSSFSGTIGETVNPRLYITCGDYKSLGSLTFRFKRNKGTYDKSYWKDIIYKYATSTISFECHVNANDYKSPYTALINCDSPYYYESDRLVLIEDNSDTEITVTFNSDLASFIEASNISIVGEFSGRTITCTSESSTVEKIVIGKSTIIVNETDKWALLYNISRSYINISLGDSNSVKIYLAYLPKSLTNPIIYGDNEESITLTGDLSNITTNSVISDMSTMIPTVYSCDYYSNLTISSLSSSGLNNIYKFTGTDGGVVLRSEEDSVYLENTIITRQENADFSSYIDQFFSFLSPITLKTKINSTYSGTSDNDLEVFIKSDTGTETKINDGSNLTLTGLGLYKIYIRSLGRFSVSLDDRNNENDGIYFFNPDKNIIEEDIVKKVIGSYDTKNGTEIILAFAGSSNNSLDSFLTHITVINLRTNKYIRIGFTRKEKPTGTINLLNREFIYDNSNSVWNLNSYTTETTSYNESNNNRIFLNSSVINIPYSCLGDVYTESTLNADSLDGSESNYYSLDTYSTTNRGYINSNVNLTYTGLTESTNYPLTSIGNINLVGISGSSKSFPVYKIKSLDVSNEVSNNVLDIQCMPGESGYLEITDKKVSGTSRYLYCVIPKTNDSITILEGESGNYNSTDNSIKLTISFNKTGSSDGKIKITCSDAYKEAISMVLIRIYLVEYVSDNLVSGISKYNNPYKVSGSYVQFSEDYLSVANGSPSTKNELLKNHIVPPSVYSITVNRLGTDDSKSRISGISNYTIPANGGQTEISVFKRYINYTLSYSNLPYTLPASGIINTTSVPSYSNTVSVTYQSRLYGIYTSGSLIYGTSSLGIYYKDLEADFTIQTSGGESLTTGDRTNASSGIVQKGWLYGIKLGNIIYLGTNNIINISVNYYDSTYTNTLTDIMLSGDSYTGTFSITSTGTNDYTLSDGTLSLNYGTNETISSVVKTYTISDTNGNSVTINFNQSTAGNLEILGVYDSLSSEINSSGDTVYSISNSSHSLKTLSMMFTSTGKTVNVNKLYVISSIASPTLQFIPRGYINGSAPITKNTGCSLVSYRETNKITLIASNPENDSNDGKVTISYGETTISSSLSYSGYENSITADSIPYGTSVTITATGNDLKPFVCWSDGNAQSTRTITLNNDLTYTAYFRATSGTCKIDLDTIYPITDDSTIFGTVSGSTDLSSISIGTSVTLTATPTNGGTFLFWVDNYGTISNNRIITEVVSYNKVYTAYFSGQDQSPVRNNTDSNTYYSGYYEPNFSTSIEYLGRYSGTLSGFDTPYVYLITLNNIIGADCTSSSNYSISKNPYSLITQVKATYRNQVDTFDIKSLFGSSSVELSTCSTTRNSDGTYTIDITDTDGNPPGNTVTYGIDIFGNRNKSVSVELTSDCINYFNQSGEYYGSFIANVNRREWINGSAPLVTSNSLYFYNMGDIYDAYVYNGTTTTELTESISSVSSTDKLGLLFHTDSTQITNNSITDSLGINYPYPSVISTDYDNFNINIGITNIRLLPVTIVASVMIGGTNIPSQLPSSYNNIIHGDISKQVGSTTVQVLQSSGRSLSVTLQVGNTISGFFQVPSTLQIITLNNINYVFDGWYYLGVKLTSDLTTNLGSLNLTTSETRNYYAVYTQQ